ncbi:AAA family ATPase [Bradyrhizobium sp. HKCCYLRH2060]|uniref:AAA family ATPase n=1 Tax=Bradyrhizobium TaxID=374 RepID=UPI002916EBB3|nr:AAA family ATPase [Bradyrhizobium sp. SZCCHNR3003]
MSAAILEPHIINDLKAVLSHGVAPGELLTPSQIEQQTALFRDRFGPAVLRELDGEALLRRMHGRLSGETRCLAYWLEFKNDDEFSGNQFGGIGGGSALKFGIYQRQSDNAWMTGSPKAQNVLSLEDAIDFARKQRDQLVAGADVLSALSVGDTSDETYAKLQAAMEKAAPKLAHDGWAHKYWFLICPDRIDVYHSPRYQRFHLFKILQMPPDGVGILDGSSPRFICAGRFIAAARELGVPVTTLNAILNRRDGAFHRYWKVGTTEGSEGGSHWAEMRDGGFVSIGWSEQVPDLSETIGQDKTTAKNRIRDFLLPVYPTNAGVAFRKAGEILNFVQEISEMDFVLACEGQTVLGVGKVRGPYEYDGGLGFPHKRPVEWLTLDSWRMPEQEGPRTTVFELGRSAANLLELEQRLSWRSPAPATAPTPRLVVPAAETAPMLPLDPFAARIEAILRRKGQVILYGPPGTGKTYRALAVANELAARHAFRKSFVDLTEPERGTVTDGDGLVRVCTFHPGWGYEDFIEGLRPTTVNGQMVFEPRDGIFKRLCADAAKQSTRNFFLVVDEINRGDLPRIFGELLTTIEYDKRDRQITLPVTGTLFSVPKNVFIIGTMNTADRSISIMDTALRRRFGFVELMPESNLLAGRKAGGLLLGAWLDALNARLRVYLKRDARNLQIGHAYLMPPQPITSVAEFSRVLRDDIIPLLEEYCYDDFGMLRDILGGELVDVEFGRIREDIFGQNREGDLIQAVSFEEMQPLIVDQDPVDSALAGEPSDISSDDSEGDDESAP